MTITSQSVVLFSVFVSFWCLLALCGFRNVKGRKLLVSSDHQMKAIEQYFHVVLFIMPYKVVLTFKFVDETLVCDHSNESY